MPSELTFEPVASAPQTARRWVERELEHLERADLADAAVLGVSELVTNAVLHVRSSIVVRVVDVDARIRIEVYDHAPRPPDGHPVVVPGGRDNESTIGRGLQIVDSISYAWGVSYEHLGKCVWFNPAPDSPRSTRARACRLTHRARRRSQRRSHPDAGEQIVDVQLVDLPVNLIAHYQLEVLRPAPRDDPDRPQPARRTDTVAHRLTVLSVTDGGAARGPRPLDPSDRCAPGGPGWTAPRGPAGTDLDAGSEIREFQQLLARGRRVLPPRAAADARGRRAGAGAALVVSRRADRPAPGRRPTPWPGGFTIIDD